MPNKELGIADPVYDALRIRSGQSIAPDLGGGSTGGGGVENKIYVWHADGSSIDTFDPDEAGLDLAIAAAATGDTIWLPSIPIACTAQKTLPANVALCGISHKAILNFTGFSTAAIVLSANSVIQDFTLNHTDGLWFSASADGSKALRIHGTADYATTGIVTTPQVSEIWIGDDTAVYWRTLAGNWQKVATSPAGTIAWVSMASDGSTLYAATGSPSNADHIYKCTNPKAVSPTWTSILQSGDTADGGTVAVRAFGYLIGQNVMVGNKIYSLCSIDIGGGLFRIAYGEYNGTSWSWINGGNLGGFVPDSAGPQQYALDQRIYSETTTLLDNLNGSAFGIGIQMYRSPAGTRYYAVNVGGHMYVRTPTTNLVDLGTTSFAGEVDSTRLTGAEGGNQVYACSAAAGAPGHLWISEDGTTFSDIVTWTAGWVKDETYNGGGTLIWLPNSVLNAAEMIRRYARNGSSNTNLTANYWSVAPAGTRTFTGLSLVYV